MARDSFKLVLPGWDSPEAESLPEEFIAAFFQDSPPTVQPAPPSNQRFSTPVTNDDVRQAKESAIPERTKKTRNDA